MKKVLVVDDCDEFREVISEMLRDEGFDVSHAGDADEAQKACSLNSFDLIICDLVLPVRESGFVEDTGDSPMVGVHMIRRLSSAYPSTPIVAVSGQLTGEPLRVIKSFGAVAGISKPFGRVELLKVVEEALGK